MKRISMLLLLLSRFGTRLNETNGLIRDNCLKSSTEGIELKIVAFKQLFPRTFFLFIVNG